MSTLPSFLTLPSHPYRVFNRCLLYTFFAAMLLCTQGIAHSETIVFDNFDDMRFDDGDPITWVTLRRDARPDASSGDLVLSPVNLGTENAGLGITGISGDVSIQTRFQAAAGVEVGLTAKLGRGPAGNDNDGYFLEVSPDGGFLGAARVNREVVASPTFSVTPPAGSGRDFVMQMDVVDNVISGWLWEFGTPPPTDPQINLELSSTIDAGNVGVYLNGGQATFRYIHIADSPIAVPEPTGALLLMFGTSLLGWSRKRRA